MVTNNEKQKELILSKIQSKKARAIFEETPLVVEELRKIANKYMHSENAKHTLQATALVNEAYISLQGIDLTINDKVHFFALAATHMRRILVDHARAKSSDKRQAQAMAITASDEALGAYVSNNDDPATMILLDEVLSQFSALDERAGIMYEMRLFAGLSNEQIAEVMELSVATVEREIRVAKAWVIKHMDEV